MTIASALPNPSISLAPKQFAARSVFPQSSYLWVIQAGFVRVLTCSEEGNSLAIGIWGAEDVVGPALSVIRPYAIECLTKVQATAVRLEDLPNSSAVLLKHLHSAEELTIIRSYRRVDVMLLKLLGWLAKRFGHEAQQGGRLIDLRLTHQDLADLLGATRVTVTRSLIQLEQQGFIQRLSMQRIVLQKTDCWHYEI